METPNFTPGSDPEQDGPSHSQRGPQRRRMPTYDVLWKRVTQAVGLLIAAAEFILARTTGKPVDANVLLFAATLIGIPLVAKGGSGGSEGK